MKLLLIVENCNDVKSISIFFKAGTIGKFILLVMSLVAGKYCCRNVANEPFGVVMMIE
jgi:hypothetical protein